MEKKRPMNARDLMHIDMYGDPQFSPTGEGFVFTSTKANGKQGYQSNIFYKSKYEAVPRQWTFSEKENAHPRFSPDGKHIVFHSDRTGTKQLWILCTEGGEAQQITSFKSGAYNPEWSADGKAIFFTTKLAENGVLKVSGESSSANHETNDADEPRVVTRLNYKSDAEGYHDDTRTQLAMIDITTRSFELLTHDTSYHQFEDMSPDGKYILFSAHTKRDDEHPESNHLFTLELGTKQIHKLTNRIGKYSQASFSPDGKKIMCFGHQFKYKRATLNELFLFNRTTREWETLTADLDLQLDDFIIGRDMPAESSNTGPVWSGDGQKVFFIGTDRGSTGLYQFDLTKHLDVLYKNDSHIYGFSYHPGTESFVLGISKPTDPCNFYSLKDKKLNKLTDANRAILDDVSLTMPEEIAVSTEDEQEVQGWLLYPHKYEMTDKYPLILQIHGGPHFTYGMTFSHEFQLLAGKGYAVLFVNPRGSQGYGQEFLNACRGDQGGGDYNDLMDSVDFVTNNFPFIDEKRLGVTGGSYGGFMTNWIIGHTSRFKVAVTQRSISNRISDFGTSDIGYYFTEWGLCADALNDYDKLWDFSPLKYVKDVNTPLLIFHSEQDLDVPIEQGEQLFVALKKLGKDVEFVRFPNANHSLSRDGKPLLRMARLNHITRWFDKYLSLNS